MRTDWGCDYFDKAERSPQCHFTASSRPVKQPLAATARREPQPVDERVRYNTPQSAHGHLPSLKMLFL